MRYLARRRGARARAFVAVVAFGAACGGDDGGSSDGDFGFDDIHGGDGGDGGDAGADDDGSGSGDAGSAVVIGTPSLMADPGSAFVEFGGGERFDYVSSGSIYLECTVSDAQVAVNFQTPDGHDLLVRGAPQSDAWFVTTTFASRDDNATYSAESIAGDGTFTIGDGALSYEGQVSRRLGSDRTDVEMVDARMAVNCAGGADPTAEIGDASYTFPLMGAQSVECTVTADAVEVRINRLALEGLQLEIQATSDDGQWLGNATVYTSDGNLSSSIPADGNGLTIDGTTVTYDGTFTTDGGDQTGTVTATC